MNVILTFISFSRASYETMVDTNSNQNSTRQIPLRSNASVVLGDTDLDMLVLDMLHKIIETGDYLLTLGDLT